MQTNLATATLGSITTKGEAMDNDQNDDIKSMNNASNVGIDQSDYTTNPTSNSGMQPLNQNSKTNTMAILSLVFSFVFNLLGLVFGIVALGQIKKTGESGKGLAIAGIIISSVGLILGTLIAGLIMLGIFSSDGDIKINSSEDSSVQDSNDDGSVKIEAPVELDVFAKAGDLRIKANSVKEFEGREFLKPVAGSIFLNIELEVENKGFDTKYISPTTQVYVKDSQNHKYNADILVVPDGSATISGELPNKESVKGLVGFELPKDAKGLKLFFEDGSLTDVDIAVIDLGR